MKPFEEQIKNDTKRLLRGQSCSTCRNYYVFDRGPECSCNPQIPLVHTCYKYNEVPDCITMAELSNGSLHFDPDSGKSYARHNGEWIELE